MSLAEALVVLRGSVGADPAPAPLVALGEIAKSLRSQVTVAKRRTPEMVRVADVRTDTNTQRPLDREKVADMVLQKAWENPIHVNQRDDDSLWVMNGQHRLEAARQADREYVPARIDHLDRETERRVTAEGASLSLLKELSELVDP